MEIAALILENGKFTTKPCQLEEVVRQVLEQRSVLGLTKERYEDSVFGFNHNDIKALAFNIRSAYGHAKPYMPTHSEIESAGGIRAEICPEVVGHMVDFFKEYGNYPTSLLRFLKVDKNYRAPSVIVTNVLFILMRIANESELSEEIIKIITAMLIHLNMGVTEVNDAVMQHLIAESKEKLWLVKK